jgi:hypothetical protein
VGSSLFVGKHKFQNDMNDDGFLDNPLAKQINVLNRWQPPMPQKDG